MNNREIALEFLRRFCAGDVDALAPLLMDDLRFRGPLNAFRTSRDYLAALKKDPPSKSKYRILALVENKKSISIFYDYIKSERSITVGQLFVFTNEKISEILLVFDGRGFDR